MAIVSIIWWIGGPWFDRERPPAPPVVLATGVMESTDGALLDFSVPVRPDNAVTDVIEPPPTRGTEEPFVGWGRPIGWYRLAAVEYEISLQLLAALHDVESNASGDACIPNRQGSGAIGPFQFKPSTFAQFGVDGNRDGVVDICGFSDSLFSAAHYLRAIGADADPTSTASRRALTRYGTDVERVVSLARAYQDRDQY